MLDFNEKKGFICDMDGVIYHGNRVLPGVNEFLEWLKSNNKEFLFLTNNSGHTPKELKQKLARMGLDVSEDHFYTSALATAAFIKDQAPGCSAYVIGASALINALYDAGVTMNDVNPDYVIVGEGNTYSLESLTRATNLVLAGAKLIGANSDISGPIENGIAPACASLISPIEMATGKKAYPIRNNTSVAVSAVQKIIAPRIKPIYIFLFLFILFLLITLQEEIERSVNQHNKQKQYKCNGEQSVSL